MGVPPAALPEAGEPLVPPTFPVDSVDSVDSVEDATDLVDVGRRCLEEAVGPLRGRRRPRAVLGRR